MDNYTGPYWSDGKLQSSVIFGDAMPLSNLDAQSRLHDTAYATYGKDDWQHRTAADYVYYQRVKNLGVVGEVAGNAVLYGNQLLRSGSQLVGSISNPVNLPSIVFGGVTNGLRLNDWSNNKTKYITDVISLYENDPHRTTHQVWPQGNLEFGGKPSKINNESTLFIPPVYNDTPNYNQTVVFDQESYKVDESPSTRMTRNPLKVVGGWTRRRKRRRHLSTK